MVRRQTQAARWVPAVVVAVMQAPGLAVVASMLPARAEPVAAEVRPI